MKKKILKLLTSILLFGAIFSMPVTAAGFMQDETGIKYQNEDGTYVANSWIQEGTLWYFFDANGICTTPAGLTTAPAETQITAPSLADTFAAAGWTIYTPTDAITLQNGIAASQIGFDGTQYWISPVLLATLVPQTPLAPTAPAAPASIFTSEDTVVPKDTTVYVTKTGSKYHLDGCRYLKSSRIPINLPEAVKIYGPCSVCKPPVK